MCFDVSNSPTVMFDTRLGEVANSQSDRYLDDVSKNYGEKKLKMDHSIQFESFSFGVGDLKLSFRISQNMKTRTNQSPKLRRTNKQAAFDFNMTALIILAILSTYMGLVNGKAELTNPTNESSSRNLAYEFHFMDNPDLYESEAAGFVVGLLLCILLLVCLCCCCCRRGISLCDILACVCLYEMCCDDGAAVGGGAGDFILV